MKKIIVMAVAAMMAKGAFAQQTTKMIRVYEGNTILFEKEYNSVDSVVFVDVTTPEQPSGDGILSGAFSVAADKQVHFSQGNLQYQASTQTWRFAENQYDMMGSDNANISASYSGWIDLFGWGTGNNPTNSSMNYNDYSTFVDWGVNAISNGGNQANLWRTLTTYEWVYLFNTRTDASVKYGQATVAGVHGIIVLPDVYEGTAINTNHSSWDNNTICAEAWAVYEAAGAVFLPAAGVRGGAGLLDVGSYGGYWSSTPTGEGYAYSLGFNSNGLYPLSNSNRLYGYSVRLVR